FQLQKYRAMTGHWCEIADRLLEYPKPRTHLIAYRNWRGIRYMLGFSAIYTDAKGMDYIADSGFIDSTGLKDEATDLVQTFRATYAGDDENWTWSDHKNSGCFSLDEAPLRYKEEE